MARTRRSDCSMPGIRRLRRGRGFLYQWPDGSLVDDAEILARIQKLAIPPAWKDVWICPWANGHLQATGTDKAGRRQYLYHEGWRRRRDAEKFARVREFGLALPALRKVVVDDLHRRGFGRERVLAAAVRLLDIGYFRVGGEQYADENDTYGVATLLREHVSRKRDALVFDYPAKHSKRRIIAVHDDLLLGIVPSLKRRRGGGAELLAWKVRTEWVDVRSSDVNAYIKEIAGGEFSAKDFRTWSATVLAAVGVATEEMSGHGPTRAGVNRVIKEVAEAIGDTPAVCRSSYIDPQVIDRFWDGVTIRPTLEKLHADALDGHLADVTGWDTRDALEDAVLDRVLQD